MEGVAALVRMINSLSAAFPIPLVAYIHDLRNEFIELLERKSWETPRGLRVFAATDGDPLLLGHLYLVRVRSEVTFTTNGCLNVTPRPDPGQMHSAADKMFESAANVYGNATIGVVLSGNGEDGTRGLLAIFQAGGSSIVQSPTEADFSGMPINALLRDHVGHVVMLDQIEKVLLRLVDEYDE